MSFNDWLQNFLRRFRETNRQQTAAIMAQFEAIKGQIKMTHEELKAQLDANTAVVEKVRGEIKVLQDLVASNPVPQAVIDSASRLSAAIAGADADNPDTAPPPPPPPPAE